MRRTALICTSCCLALSGLAILAGGRATPAMPTFADYLKAWPPTDWRAHFDSPNCQRRLQRDAAFMKASSRSSGFYCNRRPMLYSPSSRLAYLKTPKAASTAIQRCFQKQFADNVWITADDPIPTDAIVFTFVRSPLTRVISAYAEIDVAYARRASASTRAAMNTTFHRMSRENPTDATRRLIAFVDDLTEHRFGGDDREHWAPTHGYPQMNFVCKQNVSFIGRLENQKADWDLVQAMAGIPPHRRSKIPKVHESAKGACKKGRPCYEKV